MEKMEMRATLFKNEFLENFLLKMMKSEERIFDKIALEGES